MAFTDHDRTHVAYCAQCSASMTPRAVHEDVARIVGQQHAQITGHVVGLVVADTWTQVDTLAGEPSLPLWD